jgi:hypothetical protein
MVNNPAKPFGALSHKKVDKAPKALWKKRTASFSRWLHIYLSMASFFIVLFFAVTGLTLNHADWFDGKDKITKHNGKVQLKWVNVKDTATIAKLEIVQYIKKQDNIKGDIGDFIIDDNQCTLSFKGPGYSADAFVDRKTGAYKVTETQSGLVAVMNDLHKGRDAGKKWGFLIDTVSVFLTLLSLSGIIMICFMKKRRASGFFVAIGGAVVCYLIYYFMVP